MEKKIIFCGLTEYKITTDGNIHYIPTQQEKDELVEKLKNFAPKDSVVVLLDKPPLDYWRLTDSEDAPIKKVKEVPAPKNPLTDHEVKVFNFDDDDITLLKILKNKLVKMQLYEQASYMRDLEKDLMLKIEYAKIKRDEDRKNQLEKEFKDSLEFGEYLVRNFKACTWWTDTTTPHTQLFGYAKNDDNSHKTYTTEQAYQYFLLDKMKASIKGESK